MANKVEKGIESSSTTESEIESIAVYSEIREFSDESLNEQREQINAPIRANVVRREVFKARLVSAKK